MDNYVCYEGKDKKGGCDHPCKDCASYGRDRRRSDRRASAVSLRLKERRYGFDRRKSHVRNTPYHRVFRHGAFRLRDNQSALVVLLALFMLLNIADYAFTLKALSAGFVEGNPVMDVLFNVGPAAAGAFKIGLTALVAALIWTFRRYRAVLEISILFVIMYMLLIFYHIYGAIRFY